ncbi:MAG TPA: hypothetical protein VFO78_03860 [Candidatus Limnocylindrales bacterium]|nr:hypothetical protein [Candidatus Limnocylindrales bacterium]
MEPVPPSAPDLATVGGAIDQATATIEALASLGEDVEDEWQYVQDLSEAWLDRLHEVAEARGAEALAPAVGTAVGLISAEAGRIADPHRAIDWLSTYPQVVLVALGERP